MLFLENETGARKDREIAFSMPYISHEYHKLLNPRTAAIRRGLPRPSAPSMHNMPLLQSLQASSAL